MNLESLDMVLRFNFKMEQKGSITVIVDFRLKCKEEIINYNT